MEESSLNNLLNEWREEITISLLNTSSLCIALFTLSGDLVCANKAMKALFNVPGKPVDSIMNPSFTKLTELKAGTSLVYEGFLTFGDYSNVNNSLYVRVYKRDEQILILGGMDTEQLIKQNAIMHNLNREINNLQRIVIKEKNTLESTLQKLNATNAELKEANATKDKFFSIISHDLKNPFNALMGFSDYLAENLKEMEPDEIEEQINMLSKASHQAYNLLEDLLIWSKSQRGTIQFNPSSLAVQDIFNEIKANLSDVASGKSISLIFENKGNPYLYADMNMLKTILRNLVSNAIKFSDRNSDIRIIAENNDLYTIITVRDKGIGISEKNIERIWQLSEQYTTKGTENEEGTGLGLVLCKEFVDKHKGKIWVESEPGKGSNFKFTLPFEK